MMDKQFFDDTEKVCWEKLEEFNNKTHVFDSITRTIKKYHTDGTGYTTNRFGETRYFNIELKNRNQLLLDNGKISGHSETSNRDYIDDNIFIESHKVADMLLDTINGLEPIYINFLLDGNTVIFNLNKLTKRPLKTGYMNIKSKGYNKFEMAKRQGLYLIDAAIFNKDGKLIKRSGEDFI